MPVEKWSDEVVVVHLADDPQFTEDLRTLEQSGSLDGRQAVLDFAAVRYLNSANFARLLHLRKHAITGNARLVLCGINTQIWGTFLVTGLDKVFQFSDNVSTALATLQMK